MTHASASVPTNDAEAVRVWLAAGGTGGHILPALAVGRELARQRPELSLHWFCGNRPGELEIYESAGLSPVVLPLSGRRRGVVEQMRFASHLLGAWKVCRTLAREQPPRLALGFGGYASAPALWAASGSGAITMIQEQNAIPGLANRLLARRAARIFCGLPTSSPAFESGKTLVTGNPVREGMGSSIDLEKAHERFGTNASDRVVLCFGGSLGARGLNELILKALESESAQGWRWIWATGRDHFDAISARLSEVPHLQERVVLYPFLDAMPEAYAVADLVISRAGAMTLAEIAVVGRPSILVPLPTSANDHQRKNAQRFGEAGAAVVIEENDGHAGQKIATCLEQFSRECDKLKALGEAAKRLGHPDAVVDIVSEILRFLE